MTTLAPHRGIDNAVRKLLHPDGLAHHQAIPEITTLVAVDSHAALYLNLVAPQFFDALSREDKRGIAGALVVADERLASAYPAEAEQWRAAAEHCRTVVARLTTAPAPVTAPPSVPTPVSPVVDTAARRATRGMFG